ncbi:MAG TPA: hypothetical protein DEP72_00255 [Clostridiales bacterium]|nr:hypothetical protein [Clostridiales bacterium]
MKFWTTFSLPYTESIKRYLGRIRGPLLDRIDLHVEAVEVKYGNLNDSRKGDTTNEF